MANKKESDSSPLYAVMAKKPMPLSDENWNIGKIFWGLLLVLLGGMALANSFGIIEVHFGNIWRLWPLMIIAAGLSILSLRNIIWRFVMILFAIFTLGAVVWVMLGNYPISLPLQKYEATVQKTSDAVKQAEVTVKAGASSLTINSAKQKQIVSTKLESNTTSLSKSSEVVGFTQQVSLSMKMDRGNGWMMGDTRNNWNITLTRDLPLELNVDTGASSTNIDMSQAMLRTLSVKTGASSLTVRLGDREDAVNVSVESGVSLVVLQIPNSVGVQLRLENGLTSNHLADLNKASDNTYESFEYSQAKKKINIVSKTGVSSFTIERY